MNLLARLRRAAPQPTEQGPLYDAVREVMEDVQSYARSHGGTIELVSVTDTGLVTIRLGGNCRGCPISAITVKKGVEERLAVLVPGVTGVRQL